MRAFESDFIPMTVGRIRAVLTRTRRHSIMLDDSPAGFSARRIVSKIQRIGGR